MTRRSLSLQHIQAVQRAAPGVGANTVELIKETFLAKQLEQALQLE
jgi:hypothetical protein